MWRSKRHMRVTLKPWRESCERAFRCSQTHTHYLWLSLCAWQLRYIHSIKRNKEGKEQHKTKDLACRLHTLLYSARLFKQITLALKTCISSTVRALMPRGQQVNVSNARLLLAESPHCKGSWDFSLKQWHSLYISPLSPINYEWGFPADISENSKYEYHQSNFTTNFG